MVKFIDFILLRFYRRRREEKEGRNSDWLPLACPQLGTWPHNPGMCPDWESNHQPFSSQAGTQSTEPHLPGATVLFTTEKNINNPNIKM